MRTVKEITRILEDKLERKPNSREILIGRMSPDLRRRQAKNMLNLYADCVHNNNTMWQNAFHNLYATLAADMAGVRFSRDDYGDVEKQEEIAQAVLNNDQVTDWYLRFDFDGEPLETTEGEFVGRSISNQQFKWGHAVTVHRVDADGRILNPGGRPFSKQVLMGNDLICTDHVRDKNKMGFPALLAAAGDPNFTDYVEDTFDRIRVQREKAAAVQAEQQGGLSAAVQAALKGLGLEAETFGEALRIVQYADGIDENEEAGIQHLMNALLDQSARKGQLTWLEDRMRLRSSRAEDAVLRHPKVVQTWTKYQGSPASITSAEMGLLQAVVMELKPDLDSRVRNLREDAEWILENPEAAEYWGEDVNLDAPFTRYPILDLGEAYYKKRDEKPDGTQLTIREKLKQKSLTVAELTSLYKQPIFQGYRKGRIKCNTDTSNTYLGKRDEFTTKQKSLSLLRDACADVITSQMKDQLAKNRRAACKAAPIADFESYEMLRKLVDKGFERDGILLPSDQQNFSRRQSAIRNVPLRHSKEWYQNAALLYKQIQLHQHRELGGEAATVESLTDSALMRQSYVLAENVVFKGTDDHEASFEEALNKIRQSLVLKGRKSRTTLGAEDLNKYKEETLPGLVESYKDFGIVPADVFRRGRTLTTFCKAFNAVADYQDLRERGSNLATAHTYLRRLSKDRNIALEMKGELALDDLNDTRYVSAEVARSLQNAYGTLRQGSFRDVEPEQLPAYLRSVQDTVASIKTHNGATIMDLEGDDVVQTTYKFKRPARFEIGNVSLTRPVEYEKALEKVVEATSD